MGALMPSYSYLREQTLEVFPQVATAGQPLGVPVRRVEKLARMSDAGEPRSAYSGHGGGCRAMLGCGLRCGLAWLGRGGVSMACKRPGVRVPVAPREVQVRMGFPGLA
jgi:hypothetical protein